MSDVQKNSLLKIAIETCDEYGYRCVEVWHSGDLKMLVKVEGEGGFSEVRYFYPHDEQQLVEEMRDWLRGPDDR